MMDGKDGWILVEGATEHARSRARLGTRIGCWARGVAIGGAKLDGPAGDAISLLVARYGRNGGWRKDAKTKDLAQIVTRDPACSVAHALAQKKKKKKKKEREKIKRPASRVTRTGSRAGETTGTRFTLYNVHFGFRIHA